MVGFVLVSHSKPLADALAAYTKMMAPQAVIEAAGGLDDGSFGTSSDKIEAAIRRVASPDGVIVLMDMGSAVMTAKMVVSDLEDDDFEFPVRLGDCPFVEGAVEGTVLAQSGSSLDAIIDDLAKVGATHKL